MFYFESAVSQIYFPGVPPLFGRRSEVHYSSTQALPYAGLFHPSSMRAMHGAASAPTHDAEQVGPDVQTNSAPHTEAL